MCWKLTFVKTHHAPTQNTLSSASDVYFYQMYVTVYVLINELHPSLSTNCTSVYGIEPLTVTAYVVIFCYSCKPSVLLYSQSGSHLLYFSHVSVVGHCSSLCINTVGCDLRILIPVNYCLGSLFHVITVYSVLDK